MTTVQNITTAPRPQTGLPAQAASERKPRPPLTIAVAGAGARGLAYAEAAARLADRARVVAVAEPRRHRREQFAEQFGLMPDRVFSDWRQLAAGPRIADIVVIALLDDLHREAAVAFAERGYHILLEKPMATTEADCLAIAQAVERAGTRFAICHVLRYTPYTLALKKLLDAGAVGEIVSVEHLEPIGYSHFAHSFVRGNWRREEESTFLLLSKSCHDIDWLSAIVDRPVVRVSSFGGLTHFRPENRPEGAADRCLDCKIEPTCAFSAPRMYRKGLREGGVERYFAEVMAEELTEEAVDQALAEGPYGRCVYACDNDVADHQVVQMEFEGGATASFTLTAFSRGEHRRTKIFGTRGQITGDGRYLEVFDFLTETDTRIDTDADGDGHSAADGHGGGDEGLFGAFISSLEGERPGLITSGLQESTASHRVVFAAERARHARSVVELGPISSAPDHQAIES